MAIPAPLEMPVELGFSQREFDIGRLQQVTPGGAGFVKAIERAEPAWFASFSTPPLRDERYDLVRAFLDELEGSLNSFLCWDPRRAMPRAYQTLQTTADPWTQAGQASCRISAMDYANSTITLDRMQAGAIVTPGDYLSCQVTGMWYLYRATSGGVVGGTNSIVVTVKPRPHMFAGFSLLPVDCRYRRPCFEAKIIGAVKEDDSVDSFPKISFKAFQFYDRSGT